ncbi:MAG: hypothetical protein U0Q21_14875 [Dermatophilaceae bacterium]
MTELRAPAERAVVQGRESVLQGWRAGRDRFVASDPGRTRLRHGMKAVIALATTFALQLGFAAVRDTPERDTPEPGAPQ